MGKPALGKGLDQLMTGQKAAGKPAAPESAKVTPVDFGRGLNTLVAPSASEASEAPRTRVLIPAWFFFAADVLLLAYCVAICADSGGPLQTGEIIFGVVSTTVAALLGVLGVLRSQRDAG
jgi:hypothetical protein